MPQGTRCESDAGLAWHALADTWRPQLQRYFWRMRGGRRERDELVMDVLVEAHAALSTAPQTRDDRDLIRRIARQVSARHQRLMRHEVQMELTDSMQAGFLRPDPDLTRERLWEWLERLLEKRPERQRAVVENQMDGLPDTVIAHRVHCTVGSVRSLRHRALRALRTHAASSPPPD